jgi:tRNA-specific 2-thiouridylase
VRCNERIKFSALLDKALALGFDAVCTGHYARLEPGPELHRAVDPGKDQSYVLAVLTPQRLEHALFPLGGTAKADVRREAAERGLQLAAKPDSHDICFVASGDTKTWLGSRLGPRPGPIVDTAGEVVGEHDGAYAYTVGQRHGLRLGRPAPDGAPRYVLEVRPADDTVVVGPRQALDADSIEAAGAVWCGPAPSPGERVGVQVRAHGEELPGVVEALDGDPRDQTVRLRLDRPVRAAAPGQTAALYAGTRVVGSATITRAGASAPAGTGR